MISRLAALLTHCPPFPDSHLKSAGLSRKHLRAVPDGCRFDSFNQNHEDAPHISRGPDEEGCPFRMGLSYLISLFVPPLSPPPRPLPTLPWHRSPSGSHASGSQCSNLHNNTAQQHRTATPHNNTTQQLPHTTTHTTTLHNNTKPLYPHPSPTQSYPTSLPMLRHF